MEKRRLPSQRGPRPLVVKHDILAALGAAGLAKTGISKDLAHRLVVLMLSRMNWVTLELSAAHSQLSSMWAVDERRVKRIVTSLREMAILTVVSPGVRGRGTIYRVSVTAIAHLTRPVWASLGADFVERLEMAFPSSSHEELPPTHDLACSLPANQYEMPATNGEAPVRDDLLTGLRPTIGGSAYKRWIEPLRVEFELDAVRLHCASPFVRDYVDRVYGDLITRELRRTRPELDRVHFTT